MFEEAVEFLAVEGAPGAVQVVTGLRLLPRVIVVQKLPERKKERSTVNLCLHSVLSVPVGRPQKKHLIENAEFLSGFRDRLLSPRLNTTSSTTSSYYTTSNCTAAAVHRVFHY